MFTLRSLSALAAYCCLAVAYPPTSAPSFAAEKVKNIADDRIEIAIDGELWGAKGVDANGIDVTVNAGVATLEGSVDNMMAKDTAVRIAQMTKGVRSVIDQLSVSADAVDDSVLRRNVLTALAEDPATDSWEMKVKAKDGKITLHGTVDSYAERELAAKVAKSTRGVREFNNELDVSYSKDRRDYEIKKEIEQRLAWDARLDDDLVMVGVSDGKVTLSGSVGSDFERTIARGDAWVSGVSDVQDKELEVAWWSRDQMQRKNTWKRLKANDIRDAINDALAYDPRVSAFNPDVKVNNGIVTLTGVVDNLKAKRAAAQDANNTVGVWRVKNYLKVRPAVARASDAIRQDVEAAFARDPWIDRYEITTSVVGGNVYLYGDVDSYFEKEQAEDLAVTVNGVTNVLNHLDVSYDYPAFSYYGHYDWDPTLYDYDYDADFKTTRTKSEREIKEDIESQLWWSPFVDENEVNVSVDDGTATLTGTVDSWSERTKAAENALEGGAFKVINELDVQ